MVVAGDASAEDTDAYSGNLREYFSAGEEGGTGGYDVVEEENVFICEGMLRGSRYRNWVQHF